MRTTHFPCHKVPTFDLGPLQCLLLGGGAIVGRETKPNSASRGFSFGPPLRKHRRSRSQLKKCRTCVSSHDPPMSLLDWDPFEDFFGPYTDSSRDRLDTSHLRSWYGEDGELVSQLPCPSCRGRGYVICPTCDVRTAEASCPECSGKGIKTCGQCLGKRSVLVKPVYETPWKDTDASSPLQVEDDKVIESMEIPLAPVRKPNRVYSSPPAEVREKIRLALKTLDARTGSVTRRMRRIHSDPILSAKRVAAIKKAKTTEAARKHMSEKQRLFFQNPENRYHRSLRLKGIPFHCSYCGLKGHRRHYCPQMPSSIRSQFTRDYRCSLCGQAGHKRTSCHAISKVASLAHISPQQRRNHRCSICKETGHNSRTCGNNLKIKGGLDAKG